MKANVEDTNFMDGMKDLLGMEQEDVEKLLDNLDSDSLLALTDAVSAGNREEAEKVISKDEDINDLFFQNKNQKKKKHPVKPSKDHQFSYGDDVAIRTPNEETGEDEFISATVYKPHAPGNTIGVKIEGKAKMVDRNKIYKLEEGIMGMIGVPNLARMQQLAGIPSQEEPEAEAPMPSILPPETAVEEPFSNEESVEDPVQSVMCALDCVANALPNIKLGDLKAIRQKIYDLQAKMNESIEMGRPRKK